jgi:hypothetical protein
MSETSKFGPFEVGAIRNKTVDEHVAHLRLSLGGDEITEPFDLYGVFVKGTETPAAHTGNGPRSLAHAALFSAAPDLLTIVRAMDADVATGEPCLLCSTAPHLSGCYLVAALRKADPTPEGA